MLKFLKNSFAAIIALFAITATITSYAGAFSSKSALAVPDGCYRDIEFTDGTLLADDQPCPPSSLPTKIVDTGTAVNVSTECPLPDDITCCYQVVNNQIVGAVCRLFE